MSTPPWLRCQDTRDGIMPVTCWERLQTLHVVILPRTGYFQLKAAPGLWSLQLTPGRSRALYEVVGSTGMGTGGLDPTHQPGGSDVHVPVVVSSFDGTWECVCGGGGGWCMHGTCIKIRVHATRRCMQDAFVGSNCVV